ncbi:uncharacterized protein LOC131301580 [Rhododendron vialii]|uniref:uncharacterized protein LOC131301580 n=1 Tax=Rhododendron vialii TaxID=182163 RepID=UPI00265F2640|nr:uncharacterized protein LOC131301580 [Rhododendron vialii]XP_058183925.1 uncharacterized protein LOC131301580 [Rhododendron vialii]
MGKSLPPTASLQEFARIIASSNHRPKRIKPISGPRFAPSPEPYKRRWVRVESEQQLRFNKKTMEEGRRPQQQQEGQQQNNRLPLAAVVSDCVKRWFQDTLKEAKAGDGAMQILVGQMYHNGYGVSRDDHKGRAWLNRASKSRSSAWKVGDKQPGYNASDSDSDDMKSETK